VGLMSGTSMDGIDAAIIKTDGFSILEQGVFQTVPYDINFRSLLENLVNGQGQLTHVERMLTLRHVEAIDVLLSKAGALPSEVDIIGFHGHTLSHNPAKKHTIQIGDGKLLATNTHIDVVNDFRSSDVAKNGQGAPLTPIYHKALLNQEQLPSLVLNIGGVSNITWIGKEDSELIGFDTGPGNALIDDWISARTNEKFDVDGKIAAMGTIDRDMLANLLNHPFFLEPPPKSLDRNEFKSFSNQFLHGLSTEVGAATLTAFTVNGIHKAIQGLSKPYKACIVVGGGRHNHSIMAGLKHHITGRVISGDDLGWRGDAVEAQAFAFLAVRSRLGLPISFPGTTGVPRPLTGGVFCSKTLD